MGSLDGSQGVPDARLAGLVAESLTRNAWQSRPYELRQMHRKDCEYKRRDTARLGLYAGCAVYAAFSLTDFLLVPDVAVTLLLVRVGISMLALLILEAHLRLSPSADRLDVICASALVSAYFGWLVITLGSEFMQSASYYMVYGAIFMMSANLLFNFRRDLSIFASASMLLGFFWSLATVLPDETAYQIAFGSFFFACFVFMTFISWKLNVERYRVFLNALQARIKHSEATERGKELLRLSNTDPLTGLANRRFIDETLRAFWTEWEQNGASFGVILVDIDFFKRFNDYHGHQQGDRCLIHVTEALSELVENRYGGTIGRFGGEEFIAVIQVKEARQIFALAEAIRRAVEDLGIEHHQRRDGESIVTVSAGAAFTGTNAPSRLERLVNQADRALYSAKASGRNCVRFFDPHDPRINDESENVAALLRIAIAQGLVSMVYQPIENPTTGELEAVEALMRLKMLDGTSIAPAVFIPIAERTGAIFDLGRWAIRTTCRELLADRLVPLASVNVSTVQLRSPGFSASVAAILGETGVAPGRLALEITEGLEIALDSKVLKCLFDLKRLGVQIWLDDFGTGFAGLSWLRVVEFDTVKIDKSFLKDCGSKRGARMFDDMIALIRNRGHRILAEGVETEKQMAAMREKGIDQVQGYFVGRPLSLAEHLETGRLAVAQPDGAEEKVVA